MKSKFWVLFGLAVVVMGASPVLANGGDDDDSGQGSVATSGSEEKLLARHDNFVFPSEFRKAIGKRLPRGSYDLALIESEDGFYLQMISRKTRKGGRVAAEAISQIVGREVDKSTDTTISLRSDGYQHSLVFQCEGFSASFPLRKVRKLGGTRS